MIIDMPNGQWIDVEDVEWDWRHDEMAIIDGHGHRVLLSALPHPMYMRSALEGHGFVDSDAPWPDASRFEVAA